MDIKDIPRDIEALKALTQAERYHLFLQLHVDGTSDELNTQFLNATEDKQAEHLLALLQAEDVAEDGYVVLSAALPKRSKDQKTNEKRMTKFAENVETILNTMHSTHLQVNMMHFENHGLLVVGLRIRAQAMPFPFTSIASILGSLPFSPSKDGQQQKPKKQLVEKDSAPLLGDEDRHQLLAICNQAFTMVRLVEDEKVLDKNLDEFMDNAMSGVSAELAKNFIQELHRLENEHAIANKHDEDCKFSKTLEKMRVRLEKRVQLTTN